MATHLETAIVALDKLDSFELEAVRSAAQTRIDRKPPNTIFCDFLEKMPAELRNRIYELVAADHVAQHHFARCKENRLRESEDNWESDSIHDQRKKVPLHQRGFMLVNKQTNREYMKILYCKKTAVLHYFAINESTALTLCETGPVVEAAMALRSDYGMRLAGTVGEHISHAGELRQEETSKVLQELQKKPAAQ